MWRFFFLVRIKIIDQKFGEIFGIALNRNVSEWLELRWYRLKIKIANSIICCHWTHFDLIESDIVVQKMRDIIECNEIHDKNWNWFLAVISCASKLYYGIKMWCNFIRYIFIYNNNQFENIVQTALTVTAHLFIGNYSGTKPVQIEIECNEPWVNRYPIWI